jgi:hypothetical protein
MSEPKSKKMVSRNVAIALGIICIVLITGLGVTMGYYVITISDKDRTITNLTDTINLANFTVLADNQTVTQAAGNYTLWTFIANFSGYVRVMVWSSTTNNTLVRVIYNATIPTFSEVAGAESNYKSVLVPEGAWEYYQYDNQVNVANGFSKMFPVFSWVGPSPSPFGSKGPTIVEVGVGSTNISENATEQVTIVYYY